MGSLTAQPLNYTKPTAGHAHNDYEHNIPFVQAYRQGFGSIEADVFLKNDSLYVSHDTNHFKPSLLLSSGYLQPLADAVAENHGQVYADKNKKLLLLIDLKTNAYPTLNAVVKAISQYPVLQTARNLQFVITGNQPVADSFSYYPNYIYFDGNLQNPQHVNNKKVALFSSNFKNYTGWNGKGVMPAAELAKVRNYIQQAHNAGKPMRFWNAPDNINTWYTFTKLGVDFINTDRVEAYSQFTKTFDRSSSVSTTVNQEYKPLYKFDADNTKVKNVILIIGDGTGLAQWYTGYTGNKGRLNVFGMRSIGLSKTSASDSYITDSGAGASAMATGNKTNNRFISVTPDGKAVPNITELVKAQNMHVGIITTGDVTDATPAAFYSHVSERSESEKIAAQLLDNTNVDMLIGSGMQYFTKRKDGRNVTAELQQKGYTVLNNVNALDNLNAAKVLLLDTMADVHANNGRGDFLTKSLDYSMNRLKKNNSGFFIMAEGAHVDHAGHDNQLDWMVQEVKDLDNAIGHAMRFADENKGTLVIVTADHETSGISLLSGNIADGYVSGQFASDDHSAIPVPVFAYGSQSREFCGVYENTEIFKKIMKLLQAKK